MEKREAIMRKQEQEVRIRVIHKKGSARQKQREAEGEYVSEEYMHSKDLENIRLYKLERCVNK